MPTPEPHTPNPSGAQVTGAYLQPLLEVAQARGVSLDALAHAADLPVQAINPLPQSLAAEHYVRLLDAGAALSAHPHFGLLVGQQVKLGTYSVYGLVLLSCQDFGQALQQTLRYEGLAHDLGRSALHVSAGMAEYHWHSHFPQASRHLAESVFAGIQVFGNWLAGVDLPPASVSFTHTAPQDCSALQQLFGSDVRFGAPRNTARFEASLLARPVPHADVGLYPVLQQHAEQVLREKQRAQTEGSIVALVRATLANNLAQDRARLPSVAHDLQLSQRTLQRKLQDAGVTFQQLLDQTRQHLAQDYLRQRSFSLTDVAFLLGYRDQSAFTHAFKEWTGQSPGHWRDTPPTV